jgi:hypothetical protein
MGVPSSGKTGIGVLLQVADGQSPATWATVANVTQLSVGGATLNLIDATHLNSPDYYMERIPGLKTSADWTGTVQWDPTDATLSAISGLSKFLEDRSLQMFRLNPTAIGISTILECDAYVAELGNIEVSPEGIMTRSFTLSPTGKVRETSL